MNWELWIISFAVPTSKFICKILRTAFFLKASGIITIPAQIREPQNLSLSTRAAHELNKNQDQSSTTAKLFSNSHHPSRSSHAFSNTPRHPQDKSILTTKRLSPYPPGPCSDPRLYGSRQQSPGTIPNSLSSGFGGYLRFISAAALRLNLDI